jgi:hypothetical protein
MHSWRTVAHLTESSFAVTVQSGLCDSVSRRPLPERERLEVRGRKAPEICATLLWHEQTRTKLCIMAGVIGPKYLHSRVPSESNARTAWWRVVNSIWRFRSLRERELHELRRRNTTHLAPRPAIQRKRRCCSARYLCVLGRKIDVSRQSARGERNAWTGWRRSQSRANYSPPQRTGKNTGKSAHKGAPYSHIRTESY